MSVQSPPAQTCIYENLPGGIHHFIFTAPCPTCVTEWFSQLTHLYENMPQSSVQRYILDFRRSGLPPMTRIMLEGRRWLASHPLRNITRIAVVHGPDFPLPLAQAFLRFISDSDQHKVNFFPAEAQREALEWLYAEN